MLDTAVSLGLIISVAGVAGILLLILRHRLEEKTKRIDVLNNELGCVQREAEFQKMAGQHTRDGLVVQTLDGRVIWANDAYCNIMLQDKSAIVGKNPLSFALPPELRPSDDEIAAFRFEPDGPEHNRLTLVRNIRGDGTQFWNQINSTIHHGTDGNDFGVLSCRDVTEQVEKEAALAHASEQLAHIAMHDGLTGVANRSKLLTVAQGLFDQPHSERRRFGILQIDLDRFKDVNDSYGHATGDAVLRHISSHMKAALPASDLLARTGGDEFVVICKSITSEHDLERIGHELRAAVESPLYVDGICIACDISVGGAIAPDDCENLDTLLQLTDYALYHVKRNGRGKVQIYNDTLRSTHQCEVRNKTDLSEAINRESMVFHFQPILHLETGHICGFESLARWDHPRHGLLEPDAFLPLVKSIGLSAELDFLAIDAACRLSADLTDTGHTNYSISINAGAPTLQHPEFLTKLGQGLSTYKVAPGTLVLEVSESWIFTHATNQNELHNMFDTLGNMGISVLLDDFTGGFFGLMRLKQHEISGFKVAPTVAQHILDDRTSSKIAAMIIELGNDLDLTGTMLGVQNKAQAQRFAALGASTIQGDWISAPLPAETIPDFLTSWSSKGVTASAIAPITNQSYLGANS